MLTGAGCAGLNEFTADFEREWNDASLFDQTLKDGDNDRQQSNAHSFAIIESGDIGEMNCGEARRSARRALTLKPDAEWPKVVIAECDLKEGDAIAALGALENLQDLKDEPRVLLGRGVAQINLGHYEQAISFIEAGLRTDNKIAHGWNALGIAYDLAGRAGDAVPAFEIAAELEPDNGAALNNLGMSYMRQGKFGQAIQAFQGALDREPALAPAGLNLRIAIAMTGDYERAIIGASEKERAYVYNNAGVAAMRRGDHDRARALFQMALDVSPVYYAVAAENLERLPRN